MRNRDKNRKRNSCFVVRGVLSAFLVCALVPFAAFATDNENDAGSEVIPPAREQAYASDEVIVTYDDAGSVGNSKDSLSLYALDESDTAASDALLSIQSLDMQVTEELSPANADSGTVAVVELPSDLSVEQAIEELSQAPGISFVQPNYYYTLVDGWEEDQAASQENERLLSAQSADEFMSPLWQPNDPYCTNTYGANQYSLYSTNIIGAWDDARCNGHITVAVLDTGCRLDHEDIVNTIDREHAYDFYNKVPLRQSPVASGDPLGHGSHVCGIMAAQANNGLGIAGASFNAKILPIKVFNDGTTKDTSTTTTDAVVKAYQYLEGLVDNGEISNLRVINLSLGYYPETSEQIDRALERRIIRMRTKYNVLTVCAGGNGDQKRNPITRASYPSDFDSCLAVTSLDRDGCNSYWSDYNMYKDISAPGAAIYSLGKDSNKPYIQMEGTSMAAPLVGGVAALVWSLDPSFTVDQVVNILKSTATPVNNARNDRSQTSGSAGAVNARQAIDRAAQESTVRLKRLAGPAAEDTAQAISEEGFLASDVVIIARSDDFKDAMSATGLAGAYNCPILLTNPSELSAKTAAELIRLGAKEVLIIGGPKALSETIDDQIRQLGITTSRIYGYCAWDTSVACAEAVIAKTKNVSQVIVASSYSFQDALSISSFAYAYKVPLVLLDDQKMLIPEAADIVDKSSKLYVPGGPVAVPYAITDAYQGIVVRMAGDTALDTSYEVAEYMVSQKLLSGKHIGVATGIKYNGVDALAGSALLGSWKGVILLVDDDAGGPTIDTFLSQHGSASWFTYVLGGTAVVSPELYDVIAAKIAA